MCFKSLLQGTEVLPILYVDAILFYPSIQKRLKIERRSRLSNSVNRACVHCEGGSRAPDRARAWSGLGLLVERIWKAFPFALPGK